MSGGAPKAERRKGSGAEPSMPASNSYDAAHGRGHPSAPEPFQQGGSRRGRSRRRARLRARPAHGREPHRLHALRHRGRRGVRVREQRQVASAIRRLAGVAPHAPGRRRRRRRRRPRGHGLGQGAQEARQLGPLLVAEPVARLEEAAELLAEPSLPSLARRCRHLAEGQRRGGRRGSQRVGAAKFGAQAVLLQDPLATRRDVAPGRGAAHARAAMRPVPDGGPLLLRDEPVHHVAHVVLTRHLHLPTEDGEVVAVPEEGLVLVGRVQDRLVDGVPHLVADEELAELAGSLGEDPETHLLAGLHIAHGGHHRHGTT
mmetsp:Transcript_74272/g.205767  ORF Transcript_74272/g.205767 Transcript_74272/m.205767 type:complete len:315 (+) Transcript_74272:283-1227(+)